jgi:hypothetical protein
VASLEFNYADLDYTQPVTIEYELAHQGSTRFASFVRAVTQSGYLRDDTQAVDARNGVQYARYLTEVRTEARASDDSAEAGQPDELQRHHPRPVTGAANPL